MLNKLTEIAEEHNEKFKRNSVLYDEDADDLAITRFGNSNFKQYAKSAKNLN